ncbi:hypothetical protein like AT5G54850 [Hibiscus trionum]|uniref:Uncharacterized protein n=1 Tax=Hibiscus trionum TaxID=183268 RepID=A0A9W7IYZ7_HIBTR|nr:hypothetical protein like AT5G54850 [Hibiscus trionum]
MAQKLEAIKGGGGSIKVGTKGTISSLITRELDSVKPTRQTPVPASVVSGSSTPKGLKLRKSLDGASTSANGNNKSYKSPQTSQKTKSLSKNPHQIPMLGFDNIALDRTPSRQKSDKKVSNIVEVVDIKCGKHPDRARSSPITNRLKKLGFSKLSQSFI